METNNSAPLIPEPDGQPKPGREGKLTANQRRFVEEYVVDRNATQSYFRAFGRRTRTGKMRSYLAARKQASLLLTHPHIQAEIAAAAQEHARRCGISARRALREAAAIAFADPADCYKPDPDNHNLPRARPWNEIPVAARKAIASVKIKRKRLRGPKKKSHWIVEELEYRHHSKTDALKTIFDYLGLTGSQNAVENLLELLRTEKAATACAVPADLGPNEVRSHDPDAT